MTKKNYLSILFGLLIGVSGCGTNDPEAPEIPLTPEQQLVENCRLVKAAAEQFAALNDGHYPIDNTDLTPDSLTLIDLLPGGQLLDNPYSGLRTSPVNGGANSPGDVGYIGQRCDATIGSYAITGVGETAGDRIITIRMTCGGELVEWNNDYTPKLDDLIVENCFIVQAAVEAYMAGNNGVIPPDRTTPNLEGNTLIDLLPNGEYLVNPVTRNATEPSRDGSPHSIGEISYSELKEYDWDLDDYVVVGYYIIGRGVRRNFTVTDRQQWLLYKERKVVENCLLVRDAVEAFAAANNGVYPAITWDELPSGESVIDLLPDGRLLLNPFWGFRDSPVNGAAAASGQVGYTATDRNGDGACDGYTIDGLGINFYDELYVIVHPPE